LIQLLLRDLYFLLVQWLQLFQHLLDLSLLSHLWHLLDQHHLVDQVQ
jgi:hypothetical protein